MLSLVFFALDKTTLFEVSRLMNMRFIGTSLVLDTRSSLSRHFSMRSSRLENFDADTLITTYFFISLVPQ